MYLWSDGRNHRISMVGGIAFCQLFDPPGQDEQQRASWLAEAAEACRKMLERGVRPLGLILDLRRVAPISDEAGKEAVASLLDRFDAARLPACLLLREPERASSFIPKGTRTSARVYTSLAGAEWYIRSGAVGRRSDPRPLL